MNTIKRMTSFILALLVLNLVVSCKKEEVNQLNQPVEDISNDSEIHKVAPWVIYLAAAVVVKVVVALAEGQYEEVTITLPDGSSKTTKKCSGIGSCAIPSSINNAGGPGDGESLSSEEIDFDINVSQDIDGEYIKLDDGRIIFTINPNNDGYNNFFYSDVISISKPYKIDNPTFFELMGLDGVTSLLVSGEYDVQTDDEEQKYIVIQ